MKECVLTNASAVVTCRPDGQQSDVHSVPSGAIAWQLGKILWVGASNSVPDEFASFPRLDARGCLVVPGLVDCHTHLAFGGWRADEFAQRVRGVSYQEIARRGGGILRTVAQTRDTSEMELLDHSRSFMRKMLRLGVTTIECKSGYGLTVADELKILRVYESLRKEGPARIVSTCLAAHTVPPEFQDNRSRSVDLVCNELLPIVADARLATFCDVFVEEGAFSHNEARRILQTALDLGMQPKLHVDQLGDSNGATLAAELGAVSADHLEYVSDEGINALARANVTPVALPLASLYLRQTPLDARRFIDQEIDVALATDFNPGSAPAYHLPLAMTLGCTMNRMTPNEALKAATIIAARAIAMDHELGSIEPSKRADLALVDAPSVDHWLYQFSSNRVEATIVGGTVAWISDMFSSRPLR
ncbi:MAG: imidazolonepropionase [Rhodothermales bacterium]|nr:imidazolonepropionase [Rhodothermales bacterium]